MERNPPSAPYKFLIIYYLRDDPRQALVGSGYDILTLIVWFALSNFLSPKTVFACGIRISKIYNRKLGNTNHF